MCRDLNQVVLVKHIFTPVCPRDEELLFYLCTLIIENYLLYI